MVSNKRRDSIEVKLHNRMLVILTTLKYGPISRTELAKKLGMTKGGISPIVTSLIAEGALQEVGIEQTSAGRKPTLLSLNGNYMNAIVVHWGRPFYEVAVINIRGDIEDSINGNIEKGETLNDVLSNLNKSIEKIVQRNSRKKIVGIGVAAPGPIDLSTKTILKPPYFNNFSNIKVDEMLGKNLNYPIFLENDADARAIAEKYFGVGKNYSDFVYISVMEGIGAGIIINGVQYRNDNSYAGEFGHLTINYKGKLCDCGNRGCLEVYSSIRAIKEKIYELEGKKVKWEDIVSKTIQGDIRYNKIINESIVALGSGIISLIHMFQPESIVIGGNIIDLGEKIITTKIKEVVTKKSIFRNYYTPEIYLSKVKNSCLKGIAMSVFEKILVNNEKCE
ncbi:hypothetical protein SH1V18_40090 [Vallitalea longa]|uniref:ROK family transcriptional regulator n=1 Tax=Vallitalea longa TaxID=2936439 RepID=A0A9W5YEE1_9FIRM|nr:ROK family transcriptional regulator [Vallitalea longa]GKX31529.1 hypothetical protein SH1V18_40090 [Vallitalea longa]